MHRFIEQDDTFNYWYDINAIYPIPRGMGDFFLKYPGGPRGTPGQGILKLGIPRGPRGGGYFLVPGYGISIGQSGDLIWSQSVRHTALR